MGVCNVDALGEPMFHFSLWILEKHALIRLPKTKNDLV